MTTPEKSNSAPTVRAIAGRLGISPATVSLALNGRRPTSFVSAETRRHVWRAAEEMGYPLARLRSRRPVLEKVGVFARTGRTTVYSQTLLELLRRLNQRGIEVLIHSVGSERESVDAARELIRRREVDAIAFVGSRHGADDVISDTLRGDLPTVFVGEVPDNAVVWQVRPDNEGGGRAAGEHLWSLGHRNVAMLFPNSEPLVAARRLCGLRDAWRDHGREIAEERIMSVDLAAESSVEEAFVKLILSNSAASEHDRVSAVFCYNDWSAAIAIRALRSRGISVPNDLSLIGFDNSVYTHILDPPLTTIDQPFETMGTMAADLLLEQAEMPRGSDTRVVIAPCELVIRGSTAPFSHT